MRLLMTLIAMVYSVHASATMNCGRVVFDGKQFTLKHKALPELLLELNDGQKVEMMQLIGKTVGVYSPERETNEHHFFVKSFKEFSLKDGVPTYCPVDYMGVAAFQ